MGKIKVAIIGVGNCASSLVQGVHKYVEIPDDADDWDVTVRSAARLAAALAEGRDDAGLYRRLAISERGHYAVLLNWLAISKRRRTWRAGGTKCSDAEATIVAAQPPGPRMHSSVA